MAARGVEGREGLGSLLALSRRLADLQRTLRVREDLDSKILTSKVALQPFFGEVLTSTYKHTHIFTRTCM